ncbi:MAG: TonB-dependent receptor [Acidobacteriota bacterium]
MRPTPSVGSEQSLGSLLSARCLRPFGRATLLTAGCLCLLPAGLSAQVEESTAGEEPPAAAKEQPAVETVREEIIVKASRTESPASATPASVVLIDAEAVESNAVIADELASVLSREVPGFAPSIQKLTGRGETQRGRNPLYLIDGVNQHNALRDGSRDGHTIDLAFVERIEVINGSNAIQGVGATGGVVNILTREPALGAEWNSSIDLRLTGSASEFDSDSLGYKVSGLTGGGGDRFGLLVGASLHERGLFFDADGEAVGLYPTQGDIMDSRTVGLFGKAQWVISENSVVSFLANDFDLERNGDFFAVAGDRSRGVPTGTAEGDPSALVGNPARNENTTFSLTLNQSDLAGGSLTAQVFDQEFKGLFEGGTFGGFFRLTPNGPPFLDQSAVVSEKTGLKLAYNRPFSNDRVLLTAGFDVFRDESAQVLDRSGREWVPETLFETLSPFAQVSVDLGDRVTLSGGARYEDARLEVDDYTTIAAANSTFVSGGEPAFDETLVNAGLIVRPTQEWGFYGAYNESFTMPDVGRVLRSVNVPGLDVDNLFDLEPVIADNIELGVEYTHRRGSARASLFESVAENGSRLSLNAAGIFEVVRQRTEIEGLELFFEFLIDEDFSLAANYALTQGEFDSDGDDSVDSDLDGLNIGPDRLNVFFNGRFGDRFGGYVQVSYFFDRDFDGPAAPTGRDFDGHALVDLSVSYELPVGQLRLGLENLLNEDYFTYFAQTEPNARADTFFKGNGRTVGLSWRVDL